MFKTLFRQIGRFKVATLLTPVFTAFEVVMGVLIPYVTAWIIDRGVLGHDMGAIYRYGGLMLLLAAVSTLMGILAGRFSALASTGFASNLREAMFQNIQTFSFTNIDKFSTSGLVTRMTTDVSNLQNAFQMLLRISVRAPLNLITSVLMCLFINDEMSLIFVVALVILGVSLFFIIRKTVKVFSQVFERYDDVNRVVQENVAAIRVVKAFVREEHENRKFAHAVEKLFGLFVRAERLQALNHPLMMLVVYGCIIAISWFGAHLVVSDKMSPGELTSLFAYVMTIMMSLMMLSMIFVQLTMSAASARRISEVLDERADITDPAENEAVPEVADGSVDFDDVSFSYNKEGTEMAISHINLHIDSGAMVGVMGPTGCGKSTLATLIARLYDATQGTVRVGGEDVRRYPLETLRDAVSMVLQKNVLFSGTILDNLRWGRDDATREECMRACDIACATEFIDQMDEGLDTHLEQGATNLSGGQRQRLCIARALLKHPRVLILDDSTSACDTATDAAIRRALATEVSDVTKIIVSQRISSIIDADMIVVMESGRIVATGTHNELLESSPLYCEIWEMQTQGDPDFD
ncbi:MAG: ABC transporter ATP-binding protein [Muribaculaceae bacterium]|nr:ABC transporter ATP-binding protein [Muribaculaceae bacterium]